MLECENARPDPLVGTRAGTYICRMRGKGGGFGIVMLLVVVAIVLLLTAKNWKAVAPTAMQVTNPGAAGPVDDHGETGAGQAVRSGRLPDLNEMRQSTDAHAEQVQEMLEEIE